MPDDSKIGMLNAKDFYIEAGNSGLKAFGGYIVEEYDPTLRGMRGARYLREMQDNDPTVGAILYVIYQSIRKIGWHTAPADQSLPSLMAQEIFESFMDDMTHTWDEFISEALSMYTYGYAPFEIVLKERKGKNADKSKASKFDDGLIGISKLAIRAQDTILRWIMDADNNEVLGVIQIPWTGGIRTIPMEKMLLFRTQSTKNNPEGRSLLRNAYRPYYFKKRIEELEAIGVERDLAGLPMMRIPAEMIAAAKTDPAAAQALQAYKTMVTNIRRNSQEGIIIPSNVYDVNCKPMFEFSLVHSGGTRQFDTSKIIDRYNQNIATTVAADFLMMGHNSRGGSAAQTSKVDMFYAAVEAMVQNMAATLNKVLVPLLGELNGIPQQYWPSFYADKAEQVDLGRLGAYINALAASGMQVFPNQDLENYLLDVAGLPEPSEEQQQQNQQVNELDRQTKIAQASQAMMPPPQQQQPGQQPPQNMGGGGGDPSKPQGQFGPQRGGVGPSAAPPQPPRMKVGAPAGMPPTAAKALASDNENS